MSAKSMKTALKGTSIEDKDAKEIISGVQAMYDKIPGFIRPMLPSLPDILKRIPSSAGKYTLNDIIQLLEWATGNPVVRELTGKLEHIALAGKSSGHVDLVLISPATANTIGKLASGIDDTPVTTVAATAIGSKLPVLIA